MDIIAQFFQYGGPWAALSALLLIMNWEREKREGKAVDHAIELLTKTQEQVLECVRSNATRLDAIAVDIRGCMTALSNRRGQ